MPTATFDLQRFTQVLHSSEMHYFCLATLVTDEHTLPLLIEGDFLHRHDAISWKAMTPEGTPGVLSRTGSRSHAALVLLPFGYQPLIPGQTAPEMHGGYKGPRLLRAPGRDAPSLTYRCV